MLAWLLTSLFAAQDPAPPATGQDPGNAAPAVAAEGTTARPAVAWDDEQAKAALDAFAKTLKGATSMATKSRALEALAEGTHASLVAPLAKLVETEKSIVLRKRAAELIANQPAAAASAAIEKLLAKPKVTEQSAVAAELVRGLSRCDYDSRQWKSLEPLFERDFTVERVPLQEAVLDLAMAKAEAAALPLLLRHLDEPVPSNVDHAENPPKEYWEARWKSWSVWRSKVKEAVFAITGQRFSTLPEAKAWLDRNPLPQAGNNKKVGGSKSNSDDKSDRRRK